MIPLISLVHQHHTQALSLVHPEHEYAFGAGTKKTLLLTQLFSKIAVNSRLITVYRNKNINNGQTFVNHKYFDEYLYSINSNIISTVRAVFGMKKLLVKKSMAPEPVVFYNTHLFYLPAIIFLILTRRDFLIDIEDLPLFPLQRKYILSARRWINYLIYHLCIFLLYFSSRRVFTASRSISKSLPRYISSKSIPYVSFATPACHLEKISAINNKWRTNFSQTNPIIVHYGGTLIPETGSIIVRDLIHCLREENQLPIKLYITGFGDFRIYESLVGSFHNLSLKLSPNLPIESLDVIKAKAHVGLCLKDERTEMARNTFPSKVFDIIDNGQHLISSPNSSVSSELQNVAMTALKKTCTSQIIASLNNIYLTSWQKHLENAIKNYNSLHHSYSFGSSLKSIEKFLEL